MEITKIIRPMGLGITNPFLVEGSDGKRYVAKFPGNPEGTKVLINEYICACIAKYLGMPIPNFKIGKFNNINKITQEDNDIFSVNGSVYCSEFIEKSTPVPDYYILTKVRNRHDAVKTLIFDVIIGNNDRNQGNLLINLKNNTLIIIDHSHVFINGAIWDCNSLECAICEPIVISEMVKSTFDMLLQCINFENSAQNIKDFISKLNTIDHNVIENIFNSIPDDWNFSEKEKKSLKEFILNRIKRIKEICMLLNIKGGD